MGLASALYALYMLALSALYMLDIMINIVTIVKIHYSLTDFYTNFMDLLIVYIFYYCIHKNCTFFLKIYLSSI